MAHDPTPRPLPLVSHRGGRQGLTCRYRCGDACASDAPNPSSNPYFADVLNRVLDRRGVLRAGAVVGLAGGVALTLGSGTAAAAPGAGGAPRGLRYETIAPNTADAVVVPTDYASNVVIRWGDPLFGDAPEFDFENQTAAAQERQFGYNNDFCGLLPLDGQRRFVLFCNHEYTIEPLMFRGYDAKNPTREQVRIGLAAHGLSVVEVTREPDGTLHADRRGRLNRRISGTTEFAVDGPAAGSELLRTSADPTGTRVLGTVNNCSGGVTPWGTFLSGEENVDQYFGSVVPAPPAPPAADPRVAPAPPAPPAADPRVAPARPAAGPSAGSDPRLARYGFAAGPSERGWETVESRFDLGREPNEANRFGWIVEVDPFDPASRPVKHTALGRFKHEGANVRLTRDGRAVAYMGDDERFDYVYKFVSDNAMRRGQSRAAREHNATLLASGTLYVARFTGDSPPTEIDGSGTLPADRAFDGSGQWIPLAAGDRSFVPGMSADEVYVFTRLAADRVGATKMDRPEDVEPHPSTGRVYMALTNNADRGKAGEAGPDEANPRADNKHGHVLELVESGEDGAAREFAWSVLLVCGDPADPSTYFGGFDRSQVSPITSPDNLAFDPHGNLWIATDSGGALQINDGLYGVSLEGPTRGRTTLFASVPRGAECCGPVVRDDLVLISVQHPGDLDGASPERPASAWPDGPGSQPRPSVVAIRHVGEDGVPGKIGI